MADIDVRVFSRPEESPENVSWDRALELWARSYLRAFAGHPNLIRLLATTSIRDLSTYEMYDAVIGGLRRGGWPQGQTVAVMRSVEAFVLGSALDIVAPGDLITQESAGDGFAEVQGALDPRFDANSSAAASFEFGLTSLIQGLKHQLEALS
ncbi:TetR/AcrR family transcriptional regulator C-terminal domain-containing protein [Brevibacterium siliguriense]|uniref:TetR/AcrR family transcriptional regulator C-terminal domain-containing protein n=1 Tax=Brevibacterium siliguriense TaxID=1136497 RepID=UPI001E330B51|nr:TetR/AcrR family transcriptional regulator C-terminal domain-containing protein [Brevibacterium siliguriense]